MTQKAVDFQSYLSYLPPRNFKSRHLPLQNINHTSMKYYKNISTPETLFNLSADVLWETLLEPQHQYTLDGVWQYIVIFGYAILIAVGIVSNGLVCFVVVRQSKHRAAQFGGKSRNLFILNLALADLVLCCISMPLTLHNLLHVNWAMGIVLCKLSPVIQAANMLVSAGTITAIAVDRYNTIVRSPRAKRQTAAKTSIAGPAFGITIMWLFSLLLATPLFLYTNFDPVYVNDVFLYNRCVEKWPTDFSKLAFSSALTAVQFIIPVCILSSIHFRISAYLKRHLRPCQGPKIKIHSPLDPLNVNGKIAPDDETLIEEKKPHQKEFLNISRKESICSENSQRSDSSRKNSDCSDSKRYSTPDISPRKRRHFLSSFRENSDFSFSFSMLSRESSKKTPRRIRRELRRNRRTTLLLACIACVYAVSWLPYHVYNFITHAAPFLTSSINNSLFHPKTLYKAFAVAHMLAMTSVCVNPFLYGWLNTNFRREFHRIYESITNCFSKIFNKKSKYIHNNNNNSKRFISNDFNDDGKRKTCLAFLPNNKQDCVIVSLFTGHAPNV